ncbi:hypothetical protein QOZ98_001407 [Planomicrobium stackebrandtii]|uniref:Uncharacterized protein n=1 Tax=Planomicrobium stackebrandtii TaxID=253160 RepID=A0ABU0GT95_9BACL|nr:hypothetical protein [Planomicrobium stackebrandtii]MDQ0428581.1 hypothetical protein [Planomicrobium stackebrandtii]
MLGLYARALEASHIPTAMVTLFPEITDKVGAPRTLHVPFKMGRPCGEPFDFETRGKVVDQLLELLTLPSGSREKYREKP